GHPPREGGHEGKGDDRDASHGPGGPVFVRQPVGPAVRLPPSVNGLLASSAVRSRLPGQRRALLVSRNERICAGGGGGSAFGKPGVDTENGLSVVPMRPMPPLASTIPDVPKSLNQPTSSGV